MRGRQFWSSLATTTFHARLAFHLTGGQIVEVAEKPGDPLPAVIRAWWRIPGQEGKWNVEAFRRDSLPLC